MGEDHVQRLSFLGKTSLGIVFWHVGTATEAKELCKQGVPPSDQQERWHYRFLGTQCLERVQIELA